MARSKKRNRSGQRDSNFVANPVVARPIRSTGLSLSPSLNHWFPDPVAAVFEANRPAARLLEQPNVNKRPRARSRTAFKFAAPPEVGVCVRRKSRREVLFALRRTGKGAKSRRRRNAWSGVSCK